MTHLEFGQHSRPTGLAEAAAAAQLARWTRWIDGNRAAFIAHYCNFVSPLEDSKARASLALRLSRSPFKLLFALAPHAGAHKHRAASKVAFVVVAAVVCLVSFGRQLPLLLLGRR